MTILPSPSAPQGSVLHLSSYRPSDFPLGSAVLCRNTAPLVSMAYGLLQRDVPCRILGKDIGAQLAAVVRKMRAQSLNDLQTRLSNWAVRESDRCINDGRSPEYVYDQHSCLLFFIASLDEDSQSIASLLAKIDLLFTDDTNGGTATRVTLSTIHKAKGQEYPTVFILDREKLMPSRYAKLPWQRQQEQNLLYVAVTRAQLNLIYITSSAWKEENSRKL